MDISQLTIGELAKVEDLAKVSIAAMADPAAPKGRLTIALGYVVARRSNPKVTIAEIEAMTLPAVQELIGITDDDGEDTDAPK